MSNKRALLYRIPLVVLSAFGLLYIVVHTPLRQYLPGYLDSYKRAMLEEFSMRIDSLEEASQMRSAYLENLISVLSATDGTREILPYDSAMSLIKDTLIHVSQNEQDLVARYEEQEGFNLGNIKVSQDNKHVFFLTPVKGTVVVPDEISEVSPYGMEICVERETPVIAPLEGTVISVTLVPGRGYELILQHSNDFVTILSGLSMVLVEQGQNVKSGKVVAHAGGKSPSSGKVVNIQVWNKGVAVDPSTVMNL